MTRHQEVICKEFLVVWPLLTKGAPISQACKVVDRTAETVSSWLMKLRKNKAIAYVDGRYVELTPINADTLCEAFGYDVVGKENKRTCSICNETKLAMLIKIGVYCDASGVKWYGKRCPSCVNASLRTEDLRLDPMTKRKCRDCSAYLPQSKYFKCSDCWATYEDVNDDFVYHGAYLNAYETD